MFTMIIDKGTYNDYMKFHSLIAAKMYGAEWIHQIQGVKAILIIHNETGEILAAYEN